MERYQPKRIQVVAAAAIAASVTSEDTLTAEPRRSTSPPRCQRKVARDATTYRAAQRNAMKVVRKYTSKAERHKVA